MINGAMEITLDSIRDVRIYQSKKGYRFSVDALLLSSFVDIPRAERIADLGAGSGVVGLLLAKKYPGALVSLFELQGSLAAIAKKNVTLNSLDDRVTVIKADIRKINPCSPSSGARRCFDIVVSNPPFRKAKAGLVSPGEERAIARHEITLKLPELAAAACSLLKAKGRFFLIYHPERLAELVDMLKEEKMEVKRMRFVHSDFSSEAKMVLVEAVKGGRVGLKVERPFTIYREDGKYSDEMLEVYGE